MVCLPSKDLHGLTALRNSVAPPVLPLSLPGHSTAQTHWLWCSHASCLWSALDLQNFIYALTMLLSQEGQGRIQGIHNSVCSCKLIKCKNELLSTWDPASLQCDGSDPHMPCNIPSSPGTKLLVPCMSSVSPYDLELSPCPQPSFVCFVGCERNRSASLAVLQAGQLGQPQGSCVPTEQAGLCRVPAVPLILCCHFTMSCHCAAHILQNCSTQRGTQHTTYQLFPSLITAAFLGMEGVSWCWLPNYGRKLWLVAAALWRQRECEVSASGWCTGSYLQMPHLLYSRFFRPLCTVMALETHG